MDGVHTCFNSQIAETFDCRSLCKSHTVICLLAVAGMVSLVFVVLGAEASMRQLSGDQSFGHSDLDLHNRIYMKDPYDYAMVHQALAKHTLERLKLRWIDPRVETPTVAGS